VSIFNKEDKKKKKKGKGKEKEKRKERRKDNGGKTTLVVLSF
jgi:hypothetical protein